MATAQTDDWIRLKKVREDSEEEDESDSEHSSVADEDALVMNTDHDEAEDRQGLLSANVKPEEAGDDRRKRNRTTGRFIWDMLIETMPTLAASTIGLTVAGELVEVVSNWQALKRIDELIILIPVLNNMKGNLEMNLSSRLSTGAFLGHLDNTKSRQSLIGGNLFLLQVQALLVSCLAGILSFVLQLILRSTGSNKTETVTEAFKRATRPKPSPGSGNRSGVAELLYVVSTAMFSASLSSLTLGSFMCSLVLLCRWFKIDPDNVTPPLASALGDLLTLCILSISSTLFLPLLGTVFSPLLLAFLLACAFIAALQVRRNRDVRHLLKLGWTPLVIAMLITSGSGLVLDKFVDKYEGFGLLAIVISGLPGGVGSVYISRISTSLHAASASAYGTDRPRLLLVAAILFAVTFPVQVCFLLFIHFAGWMELQLAFVVVFMIMFSIAVITSLTLANFLTHWLWSRNLDPDMYAMPIQSSLMDVIAQCLLLATYEVAVRFGDKLGAKPLT